MSEREKFESQLVGRTAYRPHDYGDRYYDPSVQEQWIGWQARAAIAASQQAAPKVMTESQRKQLSRCLNGGVHMGWISDTEANELGDVIEASAVPDATLVKALREIVKNDPFNTHNSSIIARVALASIPPTQEVTK